MKKCLRLPCAICCHSDKQSKTLANINKNSVLWCCNCTIFFPRVLCLNLPLWYIEYLGLWSAARRGGAQQTQQFCFCPCPSPELETVRGSRSAWAAGMMWNAVCATWTAQLSLLQIFVPLSGNLAESRKLFENMLLIRRDLDVLYRIIIFPEVCLVSKGCELQNVLKISSLYWISVMMNYYCMERQNKRALFVRLMLWEKHE